MGAYFDAFCTIQSMGGTFSDQLDVILLYFFVFRWVVTPTVKTTGTYTFFHDILVKARQYVLKVRFVPRGGCPARARRDRLGRATTTTLRADHASRVRETRGARDERCATTIRIDAMPRVGRVDARVHAREDARGGVDRGVGSNDRAVARSRRARGVDARGGAGDA